MSQPADEPKTAREPPREPGDHAERPPAARNSPRKNIGGEIGGPQGPEPTRYGDWERNGRCTDF